MRRFFLGSAAVLCAVVFPSGQSAGPATGDPFREFTLFDRQLKSIVQTARRTRLAEAEVRRAPGAPETIRNLLDSNKVELALEGLRLAVAGSFDQTLSALLAFSERFTMLQDDATRGYPAKVAEIIQPLRSKLADLPREDAARLARALMGIDNQLNQGGSRGWAERLRAYIQEYAGTKAGLLAEVDSLSTGTDLAARINALDAFWKAHPASEVGAKALYMKGFELHVNVAITGVERRGSDPLARFLQVVAIVDELESGSYPDCEWVKKAPELISGFFVSQSPKPSYAEGSIDRMLAEYRRFVLAHFGPIGGEDTADSSIGYVVTTKMGDLYELQGDRVGGVERTIAALEALPEHRPAAELFHAQYLVNQATGGPEGNRAAMRSRAETALQALADAKDGYYSRKAAAVLAGLHMFHRDYARALPAFQRYASEYQESSWAWVAELRAAQCLTSLGQTEQAADLYERIATRPAAEPITIAISSTLAGQTHDALGRFGRSLPAYRRASNAWSADFLNDATPTPSQVRLPAPATGASLARLAVTLENITDRIASLERHTGEPAGAVVERAIWQVEHREFAAAHNTARQALGQSRNPVLQAEARAVGHRAQLELAMEQAAIEGAKLDEGAALRAFNAISDARFDSNIGLAGIAGATLLFKDGKAEPARAQMTSTLDAWLTAQRPLRARRPASPTEADIVEIRAAIFQPTGGFRLLAEKHWNAFTFPSAVSYVIVNPDVRVKVGTGRFSRLTVHQDFPGLERVLFLSTDDLALASRLIITLGGTASRQPTDVMETPNQPAGRAVDVMGFWNGFFPMRQGHWGGWVLETYPIIDRIEFLDEARTRASVFVTVGYSGATVVMEKRNGVWQAISLTNQWIT